MRKRLWWIGPLALLIIAHLTGLAFGQFYDVNELPVTGLTNSAQAIRATPGPILWYECYSPNTANTFLQFYDTNAAVVVGTTAPTLFAEVGTGSTGFVPLKAPGATTGYIAKTGLQVAATTTVSGGSAPVSPVACSFGYR